MRLIFHIVSVSILYLADCPFTSAAEPTPRAGWKVELVAQAPDIVHPSVVTTAPDGRVFVAEDPMDIRIDTPADSTNGRIWCLHPDGRRTLFADKLHAVYGMQYLEGSLYVLHNPSLTVFRDDEGVGKEPRDILTHTLPEPWVGGWNDHIPANFKLGMDGYFYLAVGDKGLDGCTGTDGRKLSLRQGGVVRFRPDGSGLEIFSTGVRNIMDVAINAEDEMFTYDNTDEKQWMGRLTHMVEAGFYGYPQDFIPRRPYTLWMMHDFGAGAACGTLCNTDDALPPEMAGHLFLADFGKRQVTRVKVERDGAGYRMAGSEELFPNPPEDFRPVGIGWSADGRSIFICDWQHRDDKANVSVGRLWKLTWTGESKATARPLWWSALASGEKKNVPVAELLTALDHPARSVRLTAQRALAARASEHDGQSIAVSLEDFLKDHAHAKPARIHALWARDAIDEAARSRALVLDLAGGKEPALAAQALRQLNQRRVAAAASVATGALRHEAAIVRLQAATLLGRVAAEETAAPLLAALAEEQDGVVRYALFTALRRVAEAQPGVVVMLSDGLAAPSQQAREGCEFALHDFYAEPLVARLALLVAAPDSPAAGAALRLLGPLARKARARGSEYWGIHPADAPPPARTEDWAGTGAVLAALRSALNQPAATLRESAAAALGEARDAASAEPLRARLASDTALPVRLAALTALNKISPAGASSAAASLLAQDTPPELRLAALKQLAAASHPGASALLRGLLTTGTPTEKLLVLRALARVADAANNAALLTAATDPALRELSIRALAAAPDVSGVPLFLEGLTNSDPAVAQDSRQALAKLGAAALPEVVKRADSLPAGIRGTLREVFKGVPEAMQHPLFASLPTADPVAYAEFAMTHAGDPWRGQQVFFGTAGTACSACHQVAGHGGVIGPDLTLAGKQFGRKEIIESILYPSRIVREGYRQTILSTTDGRELMGVARATPEGVTLTDLAGTATAIPTAQIKERRDLPNSLMPEGLHAALTPEQFADLVAYMGSRTNDPRTAPAPPLPAGFIPLFNGRDLDGWRTTDKNRTHWSVKNGHLFHDGVDGDLWSEKDLGDFELLVEWRWPGLPRVVEFPVINADGHELTRTERVLDAGDSGVFLRGLYKAQANLFCYPVGSGEFWEYRSSLDGAARRAVTPAMRADAPLGDWNTMRVIVKGDRVTVLLNGEKVVNEATLPGLPAHGPMGLQHEHGALEIRTVAVRALP